MTLQYDEWNGKEKTGKVVTEVATRWFGDASTCPNWIMDDQPREGLVWTEECGSAEGERVIAWMPLPEPYEVEYEEGNIRM